MHIEKYARLWYNYYSFVSIRSGLAQRKGLIHEKGDTLTATHGSVLTPDVQQAIEETNPFAPTYWALCDYACRDGLEPVTVSVVLTGGSTTNITVVELGSAIGTISPWRPSYYIEHLLTARHGQEPLLFSRASDTYDYATRRRIASPIMQVSWHKLPHSMAVDLKRIASYIS